MENYQSLPQELWIKVLQFVSVKDLCSVAAVSSYLHHVTSDPSLWCNSRLNKQKLNSSFHELFQCPRFQSLKRLDLAGLNLVTLSLTEAISRHLLSPSCHLTDVSFEGVTFSNVPAYILADIVSHLHKVSFSGTNLSYSQCTAILNQICAQTEGSGHRRPAHPLEDPTSSRRSPNLLEDPTSSRRSPNLLEDLNLEMVDLSSIPSTLLISSLSLVTRVNVRRTGLSTSQISSFFSHLTSPGDSPIHLTHLNLRYIDLSLVPSDLLATAICRLSSVVLAFSKLKPNQCLAILDVLQQNPVSSRCQEINFCRVNLATIPNELIAGTLSRLKKLNVRWSKLSPSQSICLLSHSVSCNTLTHLNLSNVSLRHVEPEDVAKAVARLEVAQLWWTELTTAQLNAILHRLTVEKNLKCLELQGVDMGEVEAELLSDAVNGLRKANLERTGLTTQQCTQILARSLTSETLRQINLCGINLNYVENHLLVQALAKLVIYV